MSELVKVSVPRLDLKQKHEVYILEDCFGHQHIVQLPLLADIDHDAELAKEVKAMEERTQAFIDVAQRRGHDIDALKKWSGCKECG
jgi:hypothetical protein